jgi:hypothetical protein
MATLIMTAELNDIGPQAWLADLLVRLPDHPAKQIDELLPREWCGSYRKRRDQACAAWHDGLPSLARQRCSLMRFLLI